MPLEQRSGLTDIFIGINVYADGQVAVRLWRGQASNASYVRTDVATALRHHLPQALAEAVEMAQASLRSESGA